MNKATDLEAKVILFLTQCRDRLRRIIADYRYTTKSERIAELRECESLISEIRKQSADTGKVKTA